MRLITAGLLAVVGMGTSVAGAFALPVAAPSAQLVELPGVAEAIAAAEIDRSRFTDGRALMIDARLGHASLAQDSAGETYLFASLTGGESSQGTPPLSLAIAIDRSGSMKGDRLANALAAAVGTVERMRDGDSVSVIAFDTRAVAVVSQELISSASKPRIAAQIRSIGLGGDTCISCGLDRALSELATSGTRDHVSRILLLSDGATNHGITDMAGMRALSARVRDAGVSISTIGVDVDFDEKMMAAIAQESTGRHYFVASPAGLPAIFAQEFDSLLSSVAQDAELHVDLAPGVEIDQVFDRSFRREGSSSVVVPFGSFGAKQEKTILIKLRVPTGARVSAPVATMRVDYRDLRSRADAHCGGVLAARVVDPALAQQQIDPFVATRLERSRTSQTLTDANRLFETGRLTEARQRLGEQKHEIEQSLALAKKSLATAAPMATGRAGIDEAFSGQLAAIEAARSAFAATPPADLDRASGGGFAPPPAAASPASRAGKAQIKANQQAAGDLAF